MWLGRQGINNSLGHIFRLQKLQGSKLLGNIVGKLKFRVVGQLSGHSTRADALTTKISHHIDRCCLANLP